MSSQARYRMWGYLAGLTALMHAFLAIEFGLGWAMSALGFGLVSFLWFSIAAGTWKEV